MPQLSVSDFMKSQGATPAAAPAQLSVSDFMKQGGGGHAPTLMDDISDSAHFLGQELKGIGSAINPINIVKGAYNLVRHPIDTVTGVAKLPGQMVEQYQSGDLDGLAQNIGNIAGSISLAGAGKLPLGAGVDSTAASLAASGAAKAGSVVASAPLNAAAYVAKTAGALGMPGASAVGSVLGKIPKFVKAGTTLWNMAKDAMAEDEAPVSTPAKQPPTTANVHISSKFSPESISEVSGTKPGIDINEAVGKGSRTVDALDPETQQALVDAQRAGKLKALEPEARKQIVEAVATGNNELARAVLKHGAVARVEADTINKIAALTEYAKAHGVNLDDITTPEARQTFADAAHAYATEKGMPVKGRYRDISPDTLDFVKRGVSNP